MLPTLQSLIRPAAMRVLLLRERFESGVAINVLDDGFQQDPYPTYARLRRKDRVHWSRLTGSWVLSWHEDVDAVLRDHRRFSNDDRNLEPAGRIGASREDEERRSMLVLDPPDHTRLRGLVSKAFTPRAVAAMEPRIAAIVEELLAPVGDGKVVDLMEVLAYPLPTQVIAEMIGVPPSDRAQFKLWSDVLARTLEPTITEAERREANEADLALDDYFRTVIAERRASPREDLISALIAAEEEGQRLTEREMVNTLSLLLVAGNETTTNLIGNGLLALLRHPEQFAGLRADPGLMESAVEELLRYDSPVQTDVRYALEDVEIGGHVVRKGQAVQLLIGAANRDPRVFGRPRELDITRGSKSHLSFGRGIHHCLGAPLARVEARIALNMLLERFPRIELADPEPRFKDHVVLRGLEALPLRLWRS